MLLPIGALAALMAAFAVHLAGTRDLGDSVIPDHSSAPAHRRLLSGSTGLAVRTTRWVLAGWVAAIALTTLGSAAFGHRDSSERPLRRRCR